jgi:CheY-like chemotaxis protein
VRTFGSGRDLVRSLEEAISAAPHVLLLDLAMPDQDGFETLRQVRSAETVAGVDPIPALALTAFTQVERERLRAAGFADRVDKPVDAEKLIRAIRSLLKDQPLPAKAAS